MPRRHCRSRRRSCASGAPRRCTHDGSSWSAPPRSGAAAAIGPAALARAVGAAGSAPRVAIVGAGIAGLTAALTLQDKGLAATVYESSDRRRRPDALRSQRLLGRRPVQRVLRRADRHRPHGRSSASPQRFDLAVVDLLGRRAAGLDRDLLVPRRPLFRRAGRPRLRAGARGAARRTCTARGLPDALEQVQAGRPRARPRRASTTGSSRACRAGTPRPSGSSSTSPTPRSTAPRPRDQSSLNLVYLLGYQPGPKGFAIFGESDERFHIAGGNQRLPEAMAAALPDVRLGWRLISVAREPRRDGRARLRDGRGLDAP